MTRTARLRCFDRGYRKLTASDGLPTSEPLAPMEERVVAEAIRLEDIRNGPRRQARHRAMMGL